LDPGPDCKTDEQIRGLWLSCCVWLSALIIYFRLVEWVKNSTGTCYRTFSLCLFHHSLIWFALQIPSVRVRCCRGINKASWTQSSKCVSFHDPANSPPPYLLLAVYSRCTVLPIFASQICPLFPCTSHHTLKVREPALFALYVWVLTCSSCPSCRICNWGKRLVWLSFRLRLSTNILCSSRWFYYRQLSNLKQYYNYHWLQMHAAYKSTFLGSVPDT
jgi:hypothetical protein